MNVYMRRAEREREFGIFVAIDVNMTMCCVHVK